jgi:hypothetical protein
MKSLVIAALTVAALGCGPDRNLLMETKFDAPLRLKLASLQDAGQTEELTVMGRCISAIDGAMRQELVDAGAEVLTMTDDLFTARISSEDVFSLASVECVTQVQLSQESLPYNH